MKTSALAFKTAIENHYTDDNDLVSIDRDPSVDSSGNLLMHTGGYYSLLAELDEHENQALTFADRKRFREAVDRCAVTGTDGKPIHGLYYRSPTKHDDQEQDDYEMLAAGSYHAGLDVATSIVRYGETTSWCYDVKNPGKKNLEFSHDRFPGLVDFYQVCALRPVSVWGLILLFITLWLKIYSSSSSTRFKTYIKFTVLRRVYGLPFCFLHWLASRTFTKKFGSVGSAFKDYFVADKATGVPHPITEIDYSLIRSWL